MYMHTPGAAPSPGLHRALLPYVYHHTYMYMHMYM